jgi:hypothetical protein
MMKRIRIRGPPYGRLDEGRASSIARFLLAFALISEENPLTHRSLAAIPTDHALQRDIESQDGETLVLTTFPSGLTTQPALRQCKPYEWTANCFPNNPFTSQKRQKNKLHLWRDEACRGMQQNHTPYTYEKRSMPLAICQQPSRKKSLNSPYNTHGICLALATTHPCHALFSTEHEARTDAP